MFKQVQSRHNKTSHSQVEGEKRKTRLPPEWAPAIPFYVDRFSMLMMKHGEIYEPENAIGKEKVFVEVPLFLFRIVLNKQISTC